MREILSRLLARPLILVELLLASLVAGVLALASPLYVIQVLNRYVAYGVDTTLATLTMGVVIAIGLEFCFRQIRLVLVGRVNRKPDAQLANATFETMTGARVAALEAVPEGARMEAATAADRVQAAASPQNVTTLLDVPFALLFLGALYLLSPKLALIAATFAFVAFCLGALALVRLRAPTARMQAAASGRGSLLAAAIGGAETVRAFDFAGQVRQRWRDAVAAMAVQQRRIVGHHALVQSLLASTQVLLGAAIIAVGATEVVAGRLDVGALIGTNILAARALATIQRFGMMTLPLAQAGQARRLMREFSTLAQEPVDGAGITALKGRIEFRDVAFLHPGARAPLFESLTLTLEPGQVLAVTGSNGAGKTTLARLIMGLIEPVRGHILIDGVDLRQLAPTWWRRQVAYLPQEPRFLPGTIAENLRAYVPELDDAVLAQLALKSGLKNFIDESPDGFQTTLTAGGRNLSLGIRRRLALARAMAGEGQVLIVDEPTEGMDREGAALVYQAMNAATERGATIIACSHDPNILKGAEVIVDLNVKPRPNVTRTKRVAPVAAQGVADPGGATHLKPVEDAGGSA